MTSYFKTLLRFVGLMAVPAAALGQPTGAPFQLPGLNAQDSNNVLFIGLWLLIGLLSLYRFITLIDGRVTADISDSDLSSKIIGASGVILSLLAAVVQVFLALSVLELFQLTAFEDVFNAVHTLSSPLLSGISKVYYGFPARQDYAFLLIGGILSAGSECCLWPVRVMQRKKAADKANDRLNSMFSQDSLSQVSATAHKMPKTTRPYQRNF